MFLFFCKKFSIGREFSLTNAKYYTTIKADLIANLITKYAGVLDLDNLPNPTPVKNIEDKNNFDIAKTQIEKK